MTSPKIRWAAELEDLASQNLLRSLRPLSYKPTINFASNDYLGLSTHPALIEAATAATARSGAGSTASRLICGTKTEHSLLEETIADFKGTEAALSFSCGYTTPLGAIPALVGPGDVVILDKFAHACLIDGARLSRARLRAFPHNDINGLESRLRWARSKHPDAQILIITESVFSMDGDLCPLSEIVSLKERYGALLFLDEAHACGVLGPQGKGLAAALGLTSQIDIHMGTLGKAFGASGGYIAGSRDLIDLLVNRARSFIFSTAPPPAAAAAAAAGISISSSSEGDIRRSRLAANAAAIARGLKLSSPPAAIIPWILGDATKALETSRELESHDILAPAIRFPTVPRNKARIRFTATSEHTIEDIAALTHALTH